MWNGNSFAFLYQNINELEHSNQVNLPRVTVIMPLKGFGEHNLHNWRSQVTTFDTLSPELLLMMLFFMKMLYVRFFFDHGMKFISDLTVIRAYVFYFQKFQNS